VSEPRDRERRQGLSRRAFLRNGTLLLAGAGVVRSSRRLAAAETGDVEPKLRIGMVTDLHYADKDPAGTRYYRETLRKFAEAAEQLERDRVDFVIELGDFVDAADSVDVEKGYLRRITKEFAATPGDHHYVLGNHCVDTLTKPEFLEIVGRPKTYYSFDAGGCHFVVLDACFRSDGEPYGRKNFHWTDANVPPAELEWLRADLDRTPHKTIAFIHQRLDVDGHYAVKNAPEVRTALEASGKVLAVFQGHFHRNAYRQIAGIHYCTLAAMVEGSGPENNAYATMEILADDAIRIRGFRKQESYRWERSGRG